MDKQTILKEISQNIVKAVLNSVKTKSAKLLAVSKTKSVEQIYDIYNQGHRDFGENYVNELVEKSAQLPNDINWHMIGHLQSNKVKKLLEISNLKVIETLDSMKLANEINTQSKKLDRKVQVYIQVNVSNDEKNGIEIPDAMELVDHIITNCPNLELVGLMSMGSIGVESEFTKVYDLKLEIFKKYKDLEKDFTLSMGTSEDYELAILNGASEIRIGTKLFGKREYNEKK